MTELKILENEALSSYSDNKPATNIDHNPIQNDKTKHVKIDRHFIKRKLIDGQL